MEIIYEGPRNLFAEFGTELCEVSGATGYTVDGVLTKGFATDEIVRFVVQFDPEEAHSQTAILAYVVRWAANKSISIHVTLHKAESGGSDGETVYPADEA